MNTTIIGVAGGTASGKSTLVKKLQEAFEGESVITLCHDYYYKAHDDLSFEERTKLNYDHPGAFDTDETEKGTICFPARLFFCQS